MPLCVTLASVVLTLDVYRFFIVFIKMIKPKLFASHRIAYKFSNKRKVDILKVGDTMKPGPILQRWKK